LRGFFACADRSKIAVGMLWGTNGLETSLEKELPVLTAV
jgi:hypothetical protein